MVFHLYDVSIKSILNVVPKMFNFSSFLPVESLQKVVMVQKGCI